jgi:anti-sigma factor (TIGR02949 family)
MFDCKRAREQLHDYVSRELPSSEAAQIDRHLLDCGECAARFRFTNQFRQSVRRAGLSTQVPAELRDRIRSAIAAEAKAGSVTPLMPRWVPMALAAALVVTLGVIWFIRQQAPLPSSTVAVNSGTPAVNASSPAALTTVAMASHDWLVNGLWDDHDFHGNGLLPKDDESAAEQSKTIATYTRQLGRPAPALPQHVVGFDREQCHLCPVGKTHIPHIQYRQGKKSISLYLVASRELRKNPQLASLSDKQYVTDEHGDESMLAWKENGLVYVLVSKQPRTELLQVAAVLRAGKSS